MAWTIEFNPHAQKQLKKLNKTVARRIIDFFTVLEALPDPRMKGKALQGTLKPYWRYRIGDYRAIVKIEDKCLTIVVLDVGHRKSIYK